MTFQQSLTDFFGCRRNRLRDKVWWCFDSFLDFLPQFRQSFLENAHDDLVVMGEEACRSGRRHRIPTEGIRIYPKQARRRRR